MASQLKQFVNTVKNNFRLIIILSLVAVFIYLIIHVYRNYVLPKLNPSYTANKEYFENPEQEPKYAVIYYFFAEWCPHCQTAGHPKTEESEERNGPFIEFMKKHDKTYINDYQINFEIVNCTDDTKSRCAKLIKKFNVEGFPTIKMVKDKTVYDFNAKPTSENLEEFINTMV